MGKDSGKDYLIKLDERVRRNLIVVYITSVLISFPILFYFFLIPTKYILFSLPYLTGFVIYGFLWIKNIFKLKERASDSNLFPNLEKERKNINISFLVFLTLWLIVGLLSKLIFLVIFTVILVWVVTFPSVVLYFAIFHKYFYFNYFMYGVYNLNYPMTNFTLPTYIHIPFWLIFVLIFWALVNPQLNDSSSTLFLPNLLKLP